MSELEKIPNFVIFQTEKGKVNIEVYFKDDTLWLTQKLICELFEKSKSTVSEHFKNIFAEGELHKNQVVREFRTTAKDGELKKIKLFENFEQLQKNTHNTPTFRNTLSVLFISLKKPYPFFNTTLNRAFPSLRCCTASLISSIGNSSTVG